MKTRFKFRAFTALILFWSLVLETISGIVLYVVPPGRIANWTDWKLWGLSKSDWGAVHTIFGYVFLVFAIFHLYYNWRAVISYIRRKVKAGLRMRWEMTTSVLLTLLIYAATVNGVPPFNTIMEWGEGLKNSWAANENQPFQAHAENLTFEEFVRAIGISKAEAYRILKENGISDVRDDLVVKAIAANNQLSPSDFYALINRKLSDEQAKNLAEISQKGRQQGGGYGWKTIAQIAEAENLPLQKVLDFLKRKGLNAGKDDVLRELAEKHGYKAFELLSLIRSLK